MYVLAHEANEIMLNFYTNPIHAYNNSSELIPFLTFSKNKYVLS